MVSGRFELALIVSDPAVVSGNMKNAKLLNVFLVSYSGESEIIVCLCSNFNVNQQYYVEHVNFCTSRHFKE